MGTIHTAHNMVKLVLLILLAESILTFLILLLIFEATVSLLYCLSVQIFLAHPLFFFLFQAFIIIYISH